MQLKLDPPPLPPLVVVMDKPAEVLAAGAAKVAAKVAAPETVNNVSYFESDPTGNRAKVDLEVPVLLVARAA